MPLEFAGRRDIITRVLCLPVPIGTHKDKSPGVDVGVARSISEDIQPRKTNTTLLASTVPPGSRLIEKTINHHVSTIRKELGTTTEKAKQQGKERRREMRRKMMALVRARSAGSILRT